MKRHGLSAVVAAVVAASAAVSADTRIEYKATEGGGSAMGTMLIGQGRIRADADATTSVIMDPTAGATTIIDHARKTYTRIGRAELQQILKLVGEMDQMMAGMPENVREMMKGRMGGAGGPQPVTVDTGTRATVAGKNCRVFRTTLNGAMTAEYCMADASTLDIPAADRATLNAAMAWSKELTDTLAKSPMMGRLADSSPFREGLVPLRTTTVVGGTRRSSEFVGVTAGALAADLFNAAPAGYKEQKLDLPKIGR